MPAFRWIARDRWLLLFGIISRRLRVRVWNDLRRNTLRKCASGKRRRLNNWLLSWNCWLGRLRAGLNTRLDTGLNGEAWLTPGLYRHAGLRQNDARHWLLRDLHWRRQ